TVAAVLPTTDSPGYITESDPKEDLEDEDDKDPEEDPNDYPVDRDDEEEEEESFGDDADDEEEDEAQTPIPFPSKAEVDRLLAIPTSPSSPLTPLSSLLPQIPSLSLPISPPPLPIRPTHLLGYRADMIRLRVDCCIVHLHLSTSIRDTTIRDTTIIGTLPLLPIPLPTSSPPFLLPSTDYRADVPEVMLPPQKRLCIAPGPRYEIEESSSAHTARPTGGFRRDYDF
ncbi:hypothetical protein Tco_0118227, partial [Tanacetum coccineum]